VAVLTDAWTRLARAARRGGIGVDVSGALNLVGALLKWLSLASVFPAAIALGYSEPVWPFLAAGGIAASVGWTLERLTRGRERIGAREGFLVVALTWLLAACFSALVYVLADEPQLASPLDAYFESMSGFTTTGATVLTDIDALSHSVAMWRQFTQWLGGVGIIVLAIAVLPRLRVGGRQFLEQESPGPEIEPLTASIRDTARRLWVLYVALTCAMVAVLSIIAWTGLDERMSFYEAVAHALTTLPTGGFSTRSASVSTFGAASQWAILAFMVIAGANFALMYLALARRDARVLARDEELRLYVGLLLLGFALLVAELASESIESGEAAVRHAAFQAASMLTTTGYASTDFVLWTPFAGAVLLALVFVGASAASTGGGIKVVRHLLIGKVLFRELDQAVHPEIVAPIRLNRTAVDERTVRAVIAFVLLYVGVFVAGTLALLAEGARTDADLGVFEAIGAAATTLGNGGPGFGFAGPFGSFDPFTGPSKAIMIVLMWLGRLEIVPIVVLLTRRYWRA
jgi:trk system potassium uptake protein TrkH